MSGVMCVYISVDQYLPSRQKSISISVSMRFYATQFLFMLKMNSKCPVLQARVHTRIRVSVHARASGCFFCLSLLTHNVSDKSTSTRVDGSHVRRPPEYACIQKCIQEHSIFARTGNRCRPRRLYVLPIAATSLSDPSSDEKDVTFCSSLRNLGKEKNTNALKIFLE